MIINNNSNSNIYSNFNPTTHHRTTALPWSIGTHHRCTGAPPERPGAHRNLRNLQNSHVEKKIRKSSPIFINFPIFGYLEGRNWLKFGYRSSRIIPPKTMKTRGVSRRAHLHNVRDELTYCPLRTKRLGRFSRK